MERSGRDRIEGGKLLDPHRSPFFIGHLSFSLVIAIPMGALGMHAANTFAKVGIQPLSPNMDSPAYYPPGDAPNDGMPND